MGMVEAPGRRRRIPRALHVFNVGTTPELEYYAVLPFLFVVVVAGKVAGRRNVMFSGGSFLLFLVCAAASVCFSSSEREISFVS